jgi:hypothetical protein
MRRARRRQWRKEEWTRPRQSKGTYRLPLYGILRMKARWVFAWFRYVLGKPHREHELQELLYVSCRTETGRYLRDIRSALPAS